jgi:hypothetical protein
MNKENWSQQAWCLIPVIPITTEVEMENIALTGQPEQKDSETPSQQIRWVVCISIIPAHGRHR